MSARYSLRVLALASTAACLCIATGFISGCHPSPEDGEPLGTIVAIAGDGELTILLSGLARPLRAVQIDVALAAGTATAAESASDIPHDVVEAALEEPRGSFTLVVADTRRLPLTNGPVARITTAGAGAPTLARARVVDDDGKPGTLTTLVR